MSRNNCPQQSELVALIRSGSVGNGIDTHLAGCEECREVARIVRVLAPIASPSRELPPVGNIYWRARARELLDATNLRRRRAVGPLRFFHLVVGIGLIAAALVVAVGPLTFGDLGMAGPLIAVVAATTGAHLLVSGISDRMGISA